MNHEDHEETSRLLVFVHFVSFVVKSSVCARSQYSRSFRRTHSLEEIGEQCLDIDPSLKPLVDRAVPLTEYAWKFRYPGEPEDLSPEETEDALAVAREVYEAILARLPQEVCP